MHRLKRFWPLWLLLVLQGLFLYWPLLDLQVSAWAYVSPEGFLWADSRAVAASETIFGRLHVVLLLLLPWLMLASAYWVGDAEASLRRKLYYLFLVVAFAPGIGVGVLNAESGRARPVDVQAFGGPRQMTAAFAPANECTNDCAFVSRSAAGGFLLMAFAWVFGDRRWIWAGILVGSVVGLAGVAAGRHFLSDVVFAAWVVYGACLAFSWLVLGTTRPSPATEA